MSGPPLARPPLTREQQGTVKAHLYIPVRLTGSFTKRYRLKRAQRDNIASAAKAALTEAVLRHDPARGRFDVFAWKAVIGAIKTTLRRETTQQAAAFQHTLSLFHPRFDPDGAATDPEEDVESELAADCAEAALHLFAGLIGWTPADAGEEEVISRETYATTMQTLREALRTLREEELELLDLRFHQDQRWPALAKTAGVSESTAKRRLAEVLAKLRAYLITHGVRDAPPDEGRDQCA